MLEMLVNAVCEVSESYRKREDNPVRRRMCLERPFLPRLRKSDTVQERLGKV
jgi:hypothetical protein